MKFSKIDKVKLQNSAMITVFTKFIVSSLFETSQTVPLASTPSSLSFLTASSTFSRFLLLINTVAPSSPKR